MSRLGIAAVAGAAGGGMGAVVGVIAASGLDVDPIDVTAWATVALAGITAVYVVLVLFQLRELENQRIAESTRWAAERDRERAARVRARSEDAAWRALTAIHDSGIRPGEGTPGSVSAKARDVFHALERAAPFVDDEDLADRMKAAGVLLWMMSWTGEALARDHVDEGTLSIRVREASERCAWALQCHLTDRPLPSWEGLPRYAGGAAQAWVYEQCRRAED